MLELDAKNVFVSTDIHFHETKYPFALNTSSMDLIFPIPSSTETNLPEFSPTPPSS